ncbi:MAG: hypothetical protein NVSMB65_14210 [Chloroflexota bacterium]
MSRSRAGQAGQGVPIGEAAERLGLNVDAVRKRIKRGTLPAYKEGERWYVVLPAGQPGVPPVVPPSVLPGVQSGPSYPAGSPVQADERDHNEPIEAAYRVAGEAAAEGALVPLATLVEELRGLADQLAELARRNEALALEVGTLRERQAGQEMQIATRDQKIRTQAEAMASQAAMIAEVQRRAETAEAERDRLATAQAAPDAPGATGGPTPDNPSPEASAGFWARVRGFFGGGAD